MFFNGFTVFFTTMQIEVIMRRTDREIKDVDEMLDIIRRGDACHLALVDQGEPYIVALNYGFEWIDGSLSLYFHCAASGKKLDIIKKNNTAGFMIDLDHELVTGDNGCSWGMKFKSVAGKGGIEVATDEEERKAGIDLIMNHYSGRTGFTYDSKVMAVTVVLRLSVSEITGKKKI